jgi:hypothetical protein
MLARSTYPENDRTGSRAPTRVPPVKAKAWRRGLLSG